MYMFICIHKILKTGVQTSMVGLFYIILQFLIFRKRNHHLVVVLPSYQDFEPVVGSRQNPAPCLEYLHRAAQYTHPCH